LYREKIKDNLSIQEKEASAEEKIEIYKHVLNHGCQLYTINPNTVNENALYGYFDEVNGTFKEGFVYNFIKISRSTRIQS